MSQSDNIQQENNEETTTHVFQQEQQQQEPTELHLIEGMTTQAAMEYAKKLVFDNIRFEEYTKGKIIRILCKKLMEDNKEGLTAQEIREIIYTNFEGKISKRTIQENMPVELKDLQKSMAGRKGAEATNIKKGKVVHSSNGMSTILAEQEQVQDVESEEEEDEDDNDTHSNNALISPSNAIKNASVIMQEQEQQQQQQQEDYNTDFERLPHTKRYSTYRILKLSKQKALEFDTAMKASLRYVYVIVENETNMVNYVYTDKEYKKLLKK